MPAELAPVQLTVRQREVLSAVVRLDSRKLAAAELGIAVCTLDHHLDAIVCRLGVRSRREAFVEAGRRGLI